MWTYKQSTGQLFDKTGKLVSTGYAGRGRGKNNPAMQDARAVGPLPRGVWKMVQIYDSARVGKRSIKLDPVDAIPGNDRHEPTGRSAFRIHGDSIRNPGTASHGCIILPRAVRLAMWASGDKLIEVVA
ncbi:Protein of unknown function DUF2778 [uncultured Caudovirales phage]|uniref:Tlde1 domain-containing protein n=1 Tax=uncultured Caudovirales phage TaxID=2100421 RepID=A0A6J5LX70_9CAUD|nr:Protein of unknown function DUF2778 [uncultured Caudovirales phage]